ncbi:hypothetical protein ACFQ4K_08295 [Tistrella bauzanensis]
MSRGMGRGGGMPADLPPTPVERPQFAATRDLLPYLWPRGRPDMKIRWCWRCWRCCWPRPRC